MSEERQRTPEELEKIAALKQQLKEAQDKTIPEVPPKAESPKMKSSIMGIVPNTLENKKIVEENTPKIEASVTYDDGTVQPVSVIEMDVKFVPPDPLAHITGMTIKWIDNRYQIHGVPGIPGGNIITLRSMGAIEQLIDNLKYVKEHFDQKEMISTK